MPIGIVLLLAAVELPATFSGDLPCADCEALRYHLDLLEEGVYFRRLLYVGKSSRGFDVIGKWTLSADGRTVELSDGGKFERRDDATLVKLDRDGKPIESMFEYDLVRAPAFAPIEPELTLRGTYTRLPDGGGELTECESGLRMAVAREAANPMLEAAYTRLQPNAGQSVFVTVDGRISMRPQPTVVVIALQTVGAGDCTPLLPMALASPELEDTYWKLLTLGDQAVIAPDAQREPHMVLRSLDHRVVGFAGCNRMMGDYDVEGDRLEFDGVAGTMMACPGVMEGERAFHDALKRTFTYRIAGDRLILLDENGKPLAELESRQME
jgi:copper homeostasis protein (lipoprotein)